MMDRFMTADFIRAPVWPPNPCAMVQDSICCTTVRYPTLERANVRASHCVFFRKNGKFLGNVSRGRRRCHAFVVNAFQNLPVSSLPPAALAVEDFFGGLISRCQSRVRFTPESGRVRCTGSCLLWAKRIRYQNRTTASRQSSRCLTLAAFLKSVSRRGLGNPLPVRGPIPPEDCI
jgi:hypothetical protein